MLAMHIGVQPAEIGDAGGRPHAAEKSVALDQQRLAAEAGRGCGGGDAGRPAAQHDHVVFAAHRDIALGLADRFRRHRSMIAVTMAGATRLLRPPCPDRADPCATWYSAVQWLRCSVECVMGLAILVLGLVVFLAPHTLTALRGPRQSVINSVGLPTFKIG